MTDAKTSYAIVPTVTRRLHNGWNQGACVIVAFVRNAQGTFDAVVFKTDVY
jgi:hypothetical protein